MSQRNSVTNTKLQLVNIVLLLLMTLILTFYLGADFLTKEVMVDDRLVSNSIFILYS